MALHVHPAHVDAVKVAVAAKKNSPFCLERHKRNVLNPPQEFSRNQFWKQLVGCLCSSVQKSGPDSALSQFLRKDPFSLSPNACEGQSYLGTYAHETISDSGLRFGPTISRRLVENLRWLHDGGWAHVKHEFLNLATIRRNAPARDCIAKERHAARLVMSMDGFGPKQSRNQWQCLGVSRYEIPLDSRVDRDGSMRFRPRLGWTRRSCRTNDITKK